MKLGPLVGWRQAVELGYTSRLLVTGVLLAVSPSHPLPQQDTDVFQLPVDNGDDDPYVDPDEHDIYEGL